MDDHKGSKAKKESGSRIRTFRSCGWNGLLEVIEQTYAEEVYLTHGNGDALPNFFKKRVEMHPY